MTKENDQTATSVTRVTEVVKPRIVSVDQANELTIVRQQIDRRLKGPEFDGAVINLYGSDGQNQPAFIETVIPGLRESYPDTPLVHIDFSTSRTRYTELDGRLQFIRDLTEGLAQAADLPVETFLAARGNKNKALSRWNKALMLMAEVDWESGDDDVFLLTALDRVEADLIVGFKDYSVGLAEKRRKPAVMILSSLEQIINSRGEPDRDFLRLIQEDVIMPLTDTGCYICVVTGEKPIRPLDERIERRFQWHELGSVAL